MFSESAWYRTWTTTGMRTTLVRVTSRAALVRVSMARRFSRYTASVSARWKWCGMVAHVRRGALVPVSVMTALLELDGTRPGGGAGAWTRQGLLSVGEPIDRG